MWYSVLVLYFYSGCLCICMHLIKAKPKKNVVLRGKENLMSTLSMEFGLYHRLNSTITLIEVEPKLITVSTALHFCILKHVHRADCMPGL